MTPLRAPASPLRIRLKCHPDGSASLTCTRSDGSTTWQRQNGSTALALPAHDLTHYAVETTLRYRQGFYGLVADGWNVEDFSAPWSRGPIPMAALEVELIVGFFDAERRSGERWTAEEFNAHAEKFVAGSRSSGKVPAPVLSDDDIARVRATRDALLARWFALQPGESLELVFG